MKTIMKFIKEFKQVCNKKNRYEELGLAVTCMLMYKGYNPYRLELLQKRIKEAINQNRIKILLDHFNSPIGYIVWANFLDDTINRLIKKPESYIHNSEWSEGNTLFILDFCCKPNSTNLCLDYLKNALPFRESNKVIWRSTKSGKLVTYRIRTSC